MTMYRVTYFNGRSLCHLYGNNLPLLQDRCRTLNANFVSFRHDPTTHTYAILCA